MTAHAARVAIAALVLTACAAASVGSTERDRTGTWRPGVDTLAVVGDIPITAGQTLALADDCSTAAVGTATGLVFVDWSTPENPVESAVVPMPASDRRLVVPCENGYYSASASGGGLDRLVGCVAPVLIDSLPEGLLDVATDLSCDPFGFLYATTPEGIRSFSAFDPSEPVEIDDAALAEGAITRLVQRGSRAVGLSDGGIASFVVSSGIDRFILVAWITYPSLAPTSVDLTSGGLAFVTDDGTSPARLMVLDVASSSSWTAAEALVGPPGATGVDVVVDGSLAFVSWGAAGVEVLDVSDPRHPAHVASVPAREGLPVVALAVASDVSGRYLLMLDAMGLRIADADVDRVRVSGIVRDGAGDPIPGALVRLEDSDRVVTSSDAGAYAITIAPGPFELAVAAFGYETIRIESTASEDVTQHVTLPGRPTGSFHGSIQLAALARADHAPGDASPSPEGTVVRVLGTGISVPSFVAYDIDGVPAGVYVAEVDRFGWTPVQFELAVDDGSRTRHDVTLASAAFFDTFEADRGWTVGSPDDDASAGLWVRAEPIGTGAGDVQPDRDDTPGPFSTAFVTGNGGDGDWLDAADVDGGQTTLTSPIIDLSGVADPILRYYRWLELDAGTGDESPDGDALTVSVSSDAGATWSEIETRTLSDHAWTQINYELWRYADVTSTMQVRFVVSDRGVPSVVEAGIDDVEIFSGAALLVPIDYTPIDDDPTQETSPTLPVASRLGPGAPNPFGARTVIPFSVPEGVSSARLAVYDVAGRRVVVLVDRAVTPGQRIATWDGRDHAGQPVAPGRYVVELRVGAETHRRSIVLVR